MHNTHFDNLAQQQNQTLHAKFLPFSKLRLECYQNMIFQQLCWHWKLTIYYFLEELLIPTQIRQTFFSFFFLFAPETCRLVQDQSRAETKTRQSRTRQLRVKKWSEKWILKSSTRYQKKKNLLQWLQKWFVPHSRSILINVVCEAKEEHIMDAFIAIKWMTALLLIVREDHLWLHILEEKRQLGSYMT